MIIKCDYCGNVADHVTGREIYPHRSDLWHKKFYHCEPCEAYVGCHEKTGEPFGRLANKTLRRWKQIAHENFDPLWKSGLMTRTQAYNWLAYSLDIHSMDCHIGMFSVEMCQKVVEVMNNERKRYAQFR